MQVHSKAFGILAGPAGTLKALSAPPLMSFLGVILKGRLDLMEEQLSKSSVPHEAEPSRDQVRPILD